MTKEVHLCIKMPYLAQVSVNSAYRQGSPKFGKLPIVDEWLMLLRAKLNRKDVGRKHPVGNVRMDLTIGRKPQPGRRPDVSNFRKLAQDVVAAAMNVDDNIFFGEDKPLVVGEEEYIQIDLYWQYEQAVQGISYDSEPAFGPSKGLGREKHLCSGFGSAYCMTCDAWDKFDLCPVNFSPEVYHIVPCRSCKVPGCPCRKEDDSWETREESIKLWWEARKNSAKFERRYWGKQ